MANEATLMVETELPIMMTVGNATAITKGSLLILASPMTVTVHAANDEAIIAGIAAEEKIANDGKVTVAVYRRGIFKVTCSAAVGTVGAVVAASGTAQKLKIGDATCLGSKGVGIALETTSGADETFLMELRPGCGGSEGLS